MRAPALALLIAAILPAAANAQAAQPLWKNISAGMSYVEVQQLYPAEKGRVHHKKGWIKIEGAAQIDGCKPDVTVYFSKAGAVRSVWLTARRNGLLFTACTEEAQQSLVSKYGEPTLRESGSGGLYTGPQITWKREGMTVRFERSGVDDWTIVYEPTTSDDV